MSSLVPRHSLEHILPNLIKIQMITHVLEQLHPAHFKAALILIYLSVFTVTGIQ